MYDVPWFSLRSSIKNGYEPLSAIAVRLGKLFDQLAGLDPLLGKWFGLLNGDMPILLPRDPATLEKLIDYREDGETYETRDYTLVALTNGYVNKWHPDDLKMYLTAGRSQYNSWWLHTADDCPPNPRLVTFSLFKQIMYASADTFDNEFSYAKPAAFDVNSVLPDRKKRPITAGWMLLLRPELASQITPPPQVIQQTRADGSLFMAATEETFDVYNPAHIAASKAIQDAIEPINRWELFKP